MRRIASISAVSCVLLLTLAVAAPVDADRFGAKQAHPAPTPVELVAPGEGPLRPLRHRFAAGMSQQMRVRIQSQMRIQRDGPDLEVPVPTIRFDLALGPTSLAADHLRYGFRVAGVDAVGEVPEEARTLIRERLRDLAGVHGTTEIDPRGGVVAFNLDLAEDAPEDLQQQTRILRDSLTIHLLPRFPEEPVGVGAEWRVPDELQLNQVNIQIATNYRLVSWEGNNIEVQVRTSTVEGAGGIPEGAEFEVNGRGRLRFELGSLRTRGRIQTLTNVAMNTPRGPMRVRVRTRTQLSPR